MNKKFSRRTILKGIGVVSLGVVLAPLRVLALPLVGSYRFGKQNATTTRFVIEVPQIFSYRFVTLKNKNRFVIDFKTPVDLSLVPQTSPLGAIKTVRMGRLDSEYFRVVLDLSKPAILAKAFTLAPVGGTKNRMVFDLKETTQATFDKKANTFTSSSGSTKQISQTKKTYVAPEPQIQRKKKTPIIVIDPGHGGKDPGAIGRTSKTREKDIVLSVGKKLRDILKRKGYKVYMTRDTDKYLKLKERARYAQKKKADLFLSIHADSNPNRSAQGFSVYTLSEKATDEESRKLAQRENAADLIGISGLGDYSKDVRSILTDFAQRQSIEEGIILASLLVNSVKRTPNVKSLTKTHRSAPFAVLKSTVPSVLAELGFLSNSREEKLLKQKGYQNTLAQTIAQAVSKYPFA
ncbi:MAG: N-acetylmuramoyl-L-alanine amidase [Alphaproteobacteria bacterium]